jgi:ADP-ribose pyrophosphatase
MFYGDNMGIKEEKTISKKIVYSASNGYISVEKHNVLIGEINTVREVVKHPLSASMLMQDGEYVYLIKQFRKSVDKMFIEVPAGLCELNEHPKDTAIRECMEEINYTVTNVEFVTKIHGSIGFSNALNYIYTGQKGIKCNAEKDFDENIEVFKVELKKALKMVISNEITDARTQNALMYLALKKGIKMF